MSLADRLSGTPSDVHPLAGCTIGRWIGTLDEDDAAAAVEALADPRWRHVELAQILQDEGLDATPDTVGRHRRSGCRCDEAGLA